MGLHKIKRASERVQISGSSSLPTPPRWLQLRSVALLCRTVSARAGMLPTSAIRLTPPPCGAPPPPHPAPYPARLCILAASRPPQRLPACLRRHGSRSRGVATSALPFVHPRRKYADSPARATRRRPPNLQDGELSRILSFFVPTRCWAAMCKRRGADGGGTSSRATMCRRRGLRRCKQQGGTISNATRHRSGGAAARPLSTGTATTLSLPNAVASGNLLSAVTFSSIYPFPSPLACIDFLVACPMISNIRIGLTLYACHSFIVRYCFMLWPWGMWFCRVF